MIRFLQKGGKLQKMLLAAILLFFCGTMAWQLTPLANTNLFGSGKVAGRLATVGDQDVLSNDVVQMARQMGQRQFGGNVPEQLMSFMIPSAADEAIRNKAVLWEARRIGLKVTDEEVRNALHQGEWGRALFPGGVYVGDDRYRDLVQQNSGMTVEKFEALVREELLGEKLTAMVIGGVAVSDAEIQKAFEQENTKVKLEYAVLTLADLEKQIKPADSELRAYFDKNKQRYNNAIPEKRRASYVVIDRKQLAQQAKAQTTPQDIQDYYTKNKEQFRTAEEIKVRHILIRTPLPGPDGKVDQKAVDAAKAKAEDVVKQLKGGADFAALAKKYSEDPGSKDKGGDLGWINRGTNFVVEFKNAAFSLQPGQISDPVKSTFGFHIIQVTDKHEAGIKPLDAVKDQIAQQLAAQKAGAAEDTLVKKVETEAKTANLDKAAADTHLQAYHSEWFGESDTLPGVGNAPDFMQAAFAAGKGGPPVTVDLPQGKAVLVVTQVQPARTPGFEEWRSHVEQDFKQERASQMLAQKTQEMADRAHATHDLKLAAREVGAAVKTSDFVSPSGNVPDLGAMSGAASVAFTLQPGQISSAIQAGQNGAVLQVLEKQAPVATDLAAKKEQIREQLLDRKRQVRWNMFRLDVRNRLEKEHKINIDKDEWKRLTGGNAPLPT
jgi:peptidyl-prolyl cis-trans isomerase D